MRFVRKKYFFIVIIIVFIAIGIFFQLSKRPWIAVPNNIISQTGEDHADNKRILYNGKFYNVIKQKTFSKNQYTNPQMNISFIYPANIKYKQITSHLVALSDPTIKDTDNNTLYIYSTTVPENSIAFKIPFTIPGSLKQTKIIKTRDFTANQEIYSDGINELTFLIIRQKDQTIVIRIPPNSDNVSQAITDIMNSIKTLN